ncbi:MAG TPA: HAMP domain-containing sensor histidine kinase [Gemmata sp.]|nr:HAMP domain-containing sensor histidine kinase [Gemmata sp.]
MTTPNELTDQASALLTPPIPVWRYLVRLAPLVMLWIVMAGLLGWMLYSWAGWSEQADRADMREWLDNTRIFRKTLAELVREYVDLLQDENPGPGYANRLKNKRNEIEEQVRATIEPTRVYSAQLPLFPEVYKLEIDFSGISLPAGREAAPIKWESSKPKPGGPGRAQLHTLSFDPLGRKNASAEIRMEYQLHTYNRMQHQHDEYHFWQTLAVIVVLVSLLFVALLVIRFFRRERARELDRLSVAAEVEHRERALLQAMVERQLVEKELLESRVKHQDAERATEELGRKILEQQLDAAKLESRAGEAEKSALELKSQLYASIGIMAGSYAHNIKNLLVRPNDLLTRCMDANGMSREQEGMLQEVKVTLGTVTERLQQILRTVRRDPANAAIARINLADLVLESQRTWGEMGRDKWKIAVTVDCPSHPLWVNGDLSHLQQAIENLVFNARDATFEMRNHLRDEAKRETNPLSRKQKLLDAASWKGEVSLSASAIDEFAVLEIRDNGIGMTDEVRMNCLNTHFTTKRDNALYEGYSAGMGLGLSFVAVVLEHHGATLEIESTRLRGTTFRIRMPLAA